LTVAYSKKARRGIPVYDISLSAMVNGTSSSSPNLQDPDINEKSEKGEKEFKKLRHKADHPKNDPRARP
jgi:hypothetical protein